MFRLIKLATYALGGYFLYEFAAGICEGRPSNTAGGELPMRRRNDRPRTVTVGDASGLERTQTVGRGVVQ